MKSDYLTSAGKQFEMYKVIGEKAIAQVPDDKLFWQYNDDSNSIATLVKHITGNMLSRWTDFFNTDGEKEWRNREAEFGNDEDLERIVYIRNMGHTVTEAINRQLTHYPYHIGQIVFIAKMVCGPEWASLSIPRGQSQQYNEEKFAKPRHKEHFTDEFLGE